jgi:hypothetical protein
MKKTIVALLAFLLLMPSCKFIKSKIFPKKVDTLSAYIDTTTEAERVDSALYQEMLKQAQQESQAMAQQGSDAVQYGQYYMIVGCFMVQENAEKYADKIRGKGYNASIITGPAGFKMVSVKSYNDFRESISEINQYRAEITPNAWVYVKH